MTRPYSEPCNICEKISVYNTKCRCGFHVCVKHKFPEKHNCNYDYKLEGRKELKEKLPVVIGEKVKAF